MIDPTALLAMLDELAEFGRQNDARETERSRRMLNVAPQTGRLLGILVRAAGAHRVLEVGTSNGYSTIWLAWAAHEIGGHVTTVERSAAKASMASANLRRAGLSHLVTLLEGAALDVLAGQTGPYDLVFLDADRTNYVAYLDLLLPRLRAGGLLVADNIISHAHELREFLRRVENDPSLETLTLPVGSGVQLTYKRR
jgi:predicted O-methyltransferase YrrM